MLRRNDLRFDLLFARHPETCEVGFTLFLDAPALSEEEFAKAYQDVQDRLEEDIAYLFVPEIPGEREQFEPVLQEYREYSADAILHEYQRQQILFNTDNPLKKRLAEVRKNVRKRSFEVKHGPLFEFVYDSMNREFALRLLQSGKVPNTGKTPLQSFGEAAPSLLPKVRHYRLLPPPHHPERAKIEATFFLAREDVSPDIPFGLPFEEISLRDKDGYALFCYNTKSGNYFEDEEWNSPLP